MNTSSLGSHYFAKIIHQKLQANRRYAYHLLLAGTSALALALSSPAALAQYIIDGEEITVPGDMNSPWTSGTLTVGNDQDASLTISNGGSVISYDTTIGANTGSTGTVTVTGPGSSWRTSDLHAGYSGNSIITIADGATVTTRHAYLGYAAGSTSTVIVTGAGSQWDLDALYAGFSGAANLIIADGGVVNSTLTYIGKNSNGTVTVTGAGSQWNITTYRMVIGDSGNGKLIISDGGNVITNSTDIYLGGSSTSISAAGEVVVTGVGSQWNVSSQRFYIGFQNIGSLTIEDGGVVTSSGEHFLGTGFESSTATVTGAGSRWDITGFLKIGGATVGNLIIADGGVVTTSGDVSFGNNVGYRDGEYVAGEGNAFITGTGSRWEIDGSLILGHINLGSLIITNGGTVSTAGDATLGDTIRMPGPGDWPESTGNGTATVTGSGSRWDIGGEITVGEEGNGILIISEGGRVSSGYSYLGSSSGSTGAVTVTGTGSQWNNEELYVGYRGGDGTLVISDGGKVTTNAYAIVGGYFNNASNGTVTVTDAGSQWITGNLAVGYSGDGTLTISNGGTVTTTGDAFIAHNTGSIGSANITGAGARWDVGGELYVGYYGDGILTISDGGHVSTAGQAISVSFNGSATGRIIIGAEAEQPATAPGTIEAKKILLNSSDNSSILFNHIKTDYVFDAGINGGADNTVSSGNGLVGDGLIKAISGRTIFANSHGDFTGEIQVSEAGIVQINNDISRATASILSGGRLEGNGIIGDTTNAGTIAPGVSIGTLTVAGNYTGDNGVLLVETVLGNDSSPTDRLVITGDVSGTTTVRVANLGGTGGYTINGIQVIEIGGISPDNAFTLAGDYVTTDGQQAVIGGAFAYTLHHRETGGATGGEWYLFSGLMTDLPSDLDKPGPNISTPRYHPAAAVYQQYPQVLAQLNTVSTLQQRVGKRFWQPQAGLGGASVESTGIWARAENNRQRSEAGRSTVDATSNINHWKFQSGLDAPLYEAVDGSLLVSGVSFSYGNANAKIKSSTGYGKIDTESYSLGTSLTWYGKNGLYVDAQGQYTWFNSDLSSTTTGSKMVKDNSGYGYVLSVEAGWRYHLNENFSLIPQIQLVYSDVGFSSFRDVYGSHVKLGSSDSFKARLGLAMDYEASWKAEDNTRSRAHVYGIANLNNEFRGRSRVSVSDIAFHTQDERLWAEIGVGGSYNWNDDKYSIYANANLGSSTKNFGDDYSFSGMAGYRMKW
ncbi:autotransporter outer membrane beta-barrel domain-containing protein [Microvirga sp. W0021]|uniref:Autotransporter outer membrane beta-barrel domain-containing protein n=1 Tax=Hohaiivirga grylli TaxID=3133970 RepID=A0ABV0BM79_9HYPH